MDGRCFWCSKALAGELNGTVDMHLKCDRAAWASNKRNGCVIAIFLMPFAGAGFLAGCLYSAVRAGFSEGLGLWKQAFDFMRKPRP